MSEQAHDIASYTTEKKTTLEYLFLVGGWFVSFFSLVIIVLISYWAIKIPEKSVNNLPIINALKGDIMFEHDDPGGKLFEEEDLSIYLNLDSDPKLPEKDKIVLKNSDQNFVNLRKEITVNELINGDQKNLTSAIEDALKKVVNSNEGKNSEPEATNHQGIVKLYLGSFDTFSQADEFRQFIKRRNDTLFNINNLKVFEQLVVESFFFRVELTNFRSKEEG
jgi:hypothetical protein